LSGPAVLRDDWERHWEAYAESVKSNPAQRLRRRVISRLLQLDGGSARVLDIGCGQGDLVAELRTAHPNAELCGIDYSQSGLDVAMRKVPGARFLRQDLLQTADPAPGLAGWATHAVCSEVLEHVDDPVTLLRNSVGYLAPDCRLVVTVPGGPMSAFDRHIGHRQHFTAAQLRRLLVDAGFQVEKSTGVGFPLFNLYRLVVIQRGESLIKEVASRSTRGSSHAARAGMAAFDGLLRLGAPESRWGWQIVALACAPADARAA
jgi:SAM-dependent methyltransferase